MRKTWITAVAVGLVGAVNAAVIYDAAPGNTTLLNNGSNDSGSLSLSGSAGSLVVTNANGSFNMGGPVSTSNINTLNGTALTAADTVTLKLTVDSISGTWRANGVQFGLVGSTTAFPNTTTDNLVFGVRAPNQGSSVERRYSFLTPGDLDLSFDATEASIFDGFSMEIVANSAGYAVTLSDIIVANSTATGITDGDTTATVTGSFTGSQFLDNFGDGHIWYGSQRFNTNPSTDPLVTNISEMSIDVIPEPATLGLVAAFGGGILIIRRRFMM